MKYCNYCKLITDYFSGNKCIYCKSKTIHYTLNYTLKNT